MFGNPEGVSAFHKAAEDYMWAVPQARGREQLETE